jgi:hypothetical protein
VQQVFVFITGNGVGRAQASLKPAADAHQELVANQVPQTVVDHFEAVQIQEQERKPVALFIFRALQSPL